MIGPSDLYRVPLSVRASQREDLLRYARLEHQATDLSWAATAPGAASVRRTGILHWLSSRLGLVRARAPSAQPDVFGSGLAAVHFEGDAPAGVLTPRSELQGVGPSAGLETSDSIVTVEPDRSTCDDVCTCEQ